MLYHTSQTDVLHGCMMKIGDHHSIRLACRTSFTLFSISRGRLLRSLY